FADVSIWSEPVAIWAGLMSNAVDLAAHLAQWRPQGYNVLALSLIGMGVIWKIDASGPTTISFPPATLEMLRNYVASADGRRRLAPLFKRCADEGGTEIYRALLSQLPLIAGIDDLLPLLDQRVVLEILFDYLSEIVEKP